MDTLPLLPNGKLDRQGLIPYRSRPILDASFIVPETPIERILARIWTQVLNVDQVGVRDRFFDLGGDSIAAMRIASHVIKQFQLEIPLGILLQSSTVKEMAAIITNNQAKRASETELARVLRKLEAMTEVDAQQSLRENNPTITNR
jgi:acyl carrier protein